MSFAHAEDWCGVIILVHMWSPRTVVMVATCVGIMILAQRCNVVHELLPVQLQPTGKKANAMDVLVKDM